MHSLVMRKKRTNQMQGDPTESERLKLPFLAYAGHRTNKATFLELGIDPRVGGNWLSGKRVLADADQYRIRQAGIGSPCA